ncbi:MAG: acetyl-CoA carboxylase biotin carboxyl carrier protein [Ignavibacteria bacterium]|nr:acetyl-CoA carboxylase biotin carboxyl carrier protein [Ignavibacteria bacterium]
MDLNLIRKLVRIVDTSGITDLEIEEDGIKIRVAKKNKNSQSTVLPQTVIQTEPAVSTSPSATAEKAPAEIIPPENLHEIKSPIVGTFYRAPAPDADAYIQVSDSVSSGSVLCIIEAMKLMNEIECDINGKVVKILVENGQPVEYNQLLFLIEPS